ncbi:MAG: alpha/beta hydrolase [Actinobacteria bacterium HGW-Actinobacteria-4]|nr:MAG: alpha/beta hydrolase [Actinobacteria bacterium HGW-Actinobacteria-4]
MTFRRSLTATAGALVVLLSLTACLPDFGKPSPSAADTLGPASDDPVPFEESRVYGQQVQWERCGALDCATILVPLDWSKPNGDTIEIAVNRHAAGNQGDRIGSLLINPGGPGGSGLDLTEYFVSSAGDRLLDSYDVIGFDPRGVGSSTPVKCGDGAELDAFYIADTVIETEADVEAARQAVADFAQRCLDISGPVVENVDTISAARDMDVIRAVVGDSELHYLGYSYGTQLGATYAQLYPHNVGRIVLDGAVDFLLPPEELSEGQAEGFEDALTEFLQWCVPQEMCLLGDDVEVARAKVAELIITARDQGFDTASDAEVNGNLMIYGVVVTLYDEASWPYLQLALNEIITLNQATIVYELANFYFDRNSVTGEYNGNSTEAFTAIGCLDDGGGESTTLADVREFEASSIELSPTFGWWFASGLGCDGWPWTAREEITTLDAAATANTMLVVGTTNDPATPYKWSVSLAERLGAGLLTYQGDGHTAYGRSNQCVIDAVDAYLVDGVLPDSGLRC